MNKNELAEKYAAKWVNKSLNKLVGVSDEYILNQKRVVQIDFLAGFNTCLTELAKQTQEPYYKGDGEHSIYELQKLCRDFKEHCYQKQLKNQELDTSLLAANARIAQLESELNFIKNADNKIVNELQEKNHELHKRVKELEQELKLKDIRISELVASDTFKKANERITTLEAKLQEAEGLLRSCVGFLDSDNVGITKANVKTYLQNKGG